MRGLGKAAVIAAVLIATGAAAQSKDAQDGPQPVGDPSRWFSPDDYPPEAQRAGEEGKVGFVATVDATGKVTDCDVAKSSGSPALDSKTCELLRAKGLFLPARSVDGAPIAGTWSSSIGWQLSGNPTIDLASGSLTSSTSIRMTIDENGRALDCTTVSAKGPMGNACVAFYPGREVMPPLTVEGKPVRATMTMTTTTTIEPLPENQAAE